jgi:hypothetical protein
MTPRIEPVTTTRQGITMTDFDANITAEIEKLAKEMTSYGYRPLDDHATLHPGLRVRHVGEKYPAAFDNGTAVVAAVFHRPHRLGDIEVIAVHDEDGRGRRVRQWADYHTAPVSPLTV